MRWSAFSLFCMLGFSAVAPQASAAGEDYGVLIISRERLEVATSCEIGIYIRISSRPGCSRSKAPRSTCRRASFPCA